MIKNMRAGIRLKATYSDNQLAGGSIDPEAWVDGEEFYFDDLEADNSIGFTQF